jgi:hypothetical protein
MDKPWYLSKTLYFNIITIALGVLEVVTKTYPVSPELLAIIIGVGNMVLRFISGGAITIAGRKFAKSG